MDQMKVALCGVKVAEDRTPAPRRVAEDALHDLLAHVGAPAGDLRHHVAGIVDRAMADERAQARVCGTRSVRRRHETNGL